MAIGNHTLHHEPLFFATPAAVRESLKGQLDARLAASLTKRAKAHDPLAQLGALFGATLVDKAVDATVTPEMIAEAVRTARALTAAAFRTARGMVSGQ